MGLFSFLKNATRSNRKIYLDASLGNTLIAGSSRSGAEAVIRSYAIDSANKGYGVVIFRDQKTGVSAYPSIASSARLIHEMDCTDNSTTDQIDIFAGLNDQEINALIIRIFDLYNEIERGRKMSYQNYITLLRSLAAKAHKKVRLDNLADFPIEEVESLNMTYCTGMEQMRNDRFLNSIRPEIRELESYFFEFSSNVPGYILSGNKSLEQIFRTKPVVEVSLDFAGKPEESLLIMTALVDTIARFRTGGSTVPGVNVIVDGAPNEALIGSGLQKLIRGGRDFHVMYTVQDLSGLVDQSNEWVEFADSYFFFRQNSNKNKEFCSEFFGTYERQKETVTQSVSNPTFWDRLSGRGSSSKSTGTSVTTEKERGYLPDVFAGLPDNQAIYYSKQTNEHTHLTVY